MSHYIRREIPEVQLPFWRAARAWFRALNHFRPRKDLSKYRFIEYMKAHFKAQGWAVTETWVNGEVLVEAVEHA